MANCSDNVYVIKYTDKSKGTITITKSSLVTNVVDIALVGKSRLDYGEIFNENMLHLLENFACPQAAGGGAPTPDLAVAFGTLLSNPILGQKWYNSTNQRLYVFTTSGWAATARGPDVAGNSGILAHGLPMPRPVAADGYVFPYSECSFSVSPFAYKSSNSGDGLVPSQTEVDYMSCYANPDGTVFMRFRYRGESSLRSGYVNYAIIGIRGSIADAAPIQTPYPVPDPTPGVSPTMTPTPTPTPTRTASPTPTPSTTPQPSLVASPTPTITPTPTVTVTRSPTPTPSAVPPSPTPTVTPSPSTVATVLLTDQFESASHPEGYSGSATAGAALYATGEFWTQSSQTGGGAISGQWLTGGSAGAFEVYATFVNDSIGSNPVSGSSLNTWLNLGTSRNWSITTNTTLPGGSVGVSAPSKEGTLTLQIRRASDSVVVATANVYLSVAIGEPI